MNAGERALTELLEGDEGTGAIEVLGRLPWSSNFTLLVNVRNGETNVQAVYKPQQGEQDLWDFPPEIYKREVAAYELSLALGWPRIPETVTVTDAPYGIGSLQRFEPADFEQTYFTLFEDPANHPALIEIAAFDVIANNTDRKAGHCLAGDDGVIYAIDNGLCFHAEPKLRTVIWEFAGEHVPRALLDDIARVAGAPPATLTGLLLPAELDAFVSRCRALLQEPVFPSLTSQRQYPWPLV